MKILSAFLSALLLIAFTGSISAQTDNSASTNGSLTFTVKSITNNSTYSPRNVFAIWIKDSTGNFVKSIKVMAAAQKKHLVKWKASSNSNTTDAITGSTLSTHQTHTVTWNCTNVAGQLVPDGKYTICVEYTSTNSASNGNQGPFLTVDFHKGTVNEHVAPANAPYYQNIVADWVVDYTAAEKPEQASKIMQVFPNPSSDVVGFSLKCNVVSQIELSIYDLSNKKISAVVHDIIGTGDHHFEWNGNTETGEKVAPGVYIARLMLNGKTYVYKIIKD